MAFVTVSEALPKAGSTITGGETTVARKIDAG